MSWLLFLDESGHDHKSCPYEVRGGIAVHASKLWQLVRWLQMAEQTAFGGNIREYGREFKGAKLLDRDRFKWASQTPWMPAEMRRKHARAFLTKGLQKMVPNPRGVHSVRAGMHRDGAYGVRGVAWLRCQTICVGRAVYCEEAAAVRSGRLLEKGPRIPLERYFYFLENERAHGLLILDSVEKEFDQRFLRQMERYFTKTHTGRCRTAWIVPVPMFVASDMTKAVQAADLAIYCVNWGFRLPSMGMDAPVRTEIATEFGPWLNGLQYRGRGFRGGRTFDSYGIVYVPNPYGDGRTVGAPEKRKEIRPAKPPHSRPPSDSISVGNSTRSSSM